MKLVRNVLIAAVLLTSLGAYAKDSPSKALKLKNTIKSIEITEIPTAPFYLEDKGSPPNKNNSNQNNNDQANYDQNSIQNQSAPADVSVSMNDQLQNVNNGVGQVVEIVDKLIAVGEKVWKIVSNGRAVVNVDGVVPSVSVLPRGLETTGSLYDMFGWSEPIMKSFHVVYKNGYGSSVIKFDFTVMMQAGGTDGNGGVYISGLSIVPDSINVAWGWDFNVQSRLINITNRGTQMAPIAAATIELGYQVTNALTNDTKRIRFFADGNGKIAQLK